MIDKVTIMFSHDGKREDYGEAKRKGNKKNERYYEIPSPNASGKPLGLYVMDDPKKDGSILEIKGSWRKWYLTDGTSRDLNYTRLNDCIGAIALKISLPPEKILNAKIKKVELGFGMRFRENMEGIINGFVFFNNFDPIYEYNRESVRFKGTSYSVVFYDKFVQLMNEFEKRVKEEEKEAKRKGIFVDMNRKSKKLLAEKMNKNNFSLRYEVSVTNMGGCPPEFKGAKDKNGKRENIIATPNDILKNWDKILDGLAKVFGKVQFSGYNLNVGLEYLNGKNLKELYEYNLHLAAIAVGGTRNYLQLLMRKLNDKHRNENVEKIMERLNDPPVELKNALQSCRNKEKELYDAKDKRIADLRKRG